MKNMSAGKIDSIIQAKTSHFTAQVNCDGHEN